MVGVHKSYVLDGIEVHALRGIDLTVTQGEYVAIMGPSGSGKSTLMNILGCLDRPTSGTYLLDVEDVSRMNREQLAHIRSRKIGFVFQSNNLLTQATAVQNVLLPIVYRQNGHISNKERLELAHEVLASAGLTDRDNHKPTEMSGGQQQRVAIARALINSPALILADEPTGNLDSHSGMEIMQIMQNLHFEGRTILMITRDARNAAYAERIVHLKDGVIDENPVTSPMPEFASKVGVS